MASRMASLLTFLLHVKHRFRFFCSGMAGVSAAASATAASATAVPAAPSTFAPPPTDIEETLGPTPVPLPALLNDIGDAGNTTAGATEAAAAAATAATATEGA